jgi:autotransporter-associated beta strand protein
MLSAVFAFFSPPKERKSMRVLHSALAPAVVRVLAVIGLAGVWRPWALEAQTTGWEQTAGGSYNYFDTSNWVDGEVNGIWDAGLTLTGNQNLLFTDPASILTDLRIRYAGNLDLIFRANGGAATLTLGGDIYMATLNNRTFTIGSTNASQSLAVDLGGGIRTLTVLGEGNANNFGRTIDFINDVSNGGIIVDGGPSGGGLVRFSGANNTLSSLTMDGAEFRAQGSAVSGTNHLTTITGALTAANGANSISLSTAANRRTLIQAGSFVREAGGTILFRGTNLGVNTLAGTDGNSSNIAFTTGPTLLGGGGASGTTTVGIIAGAFGDTNATGNGFGPTGGLVTYEDTYGVRLLSESEYKTFIEDGQTQLDNIRIANSSGAVAETTLTSGTTTINSLSLDVSGDSGNQGITITGDPGTTLKLNSGVIYARQDVTTGGNPNASDAMVINVPILDLNGQEGIILVNTRMNTGGTVTSNAGLIINSTITNGTGLIIGDGTSGSGYVILGGSEANTYTGVTTINGAVVRLDKVPDDTFGDIVINLGSVYNTGNQIADDASVTINAGTLYMNGTNNSGSATSDTWENLTMTGGTLSWGSGSGNAVNLLGDLSLSGGRINMAVNSDLNVSGTSTLTGGVISVNRSNNLTFGAQAQLNGPVHISNVAAGEAPYTPITIAPGNASSFGGYLEISGDVTFTGNATNRNTVTIAAPTGAGPQGVLALNGNINFLIGDGAASVDLTVEAPIVDGASAGGLAMSGPGTLGLYGASSYTGGTVINSGRVLVMNSEGSATGTGDVTLNAATLAGTGSISGVVSTNGAGSVFSPGVDGAATLTLGGLNAANGATFHFELGTESDVLSLGTGVFTGSAAAGGLAFHFTDLDGFAAGNPYTIITFGSAVDLDYTDLVASILPDGYMLDASFGMGGFQINGNDLQVQFTVVPEPSTAILVLVPLALAARRSRRERR